jgi:hypothetical protein
VKRFVSALLSDDQGRLDEQAIISIAGAAVFLALEIYSVVVRGQTFDPFGFGTGIGALLGAASAGFGLRARLSSNSQTLAGIDPMTGRFYGGTNAGNSS